MENNEWMERKVRALAVLRERLGGARERLRAIDERLLVYFDDLATHASADPEDADDFVRKVNTYISNDLLPGRDGVFSYESISNPLEIGVIRKMVEEVVG